jgi:arginine/lysine/ornithine decarboxylase
VVVVTTPTYEGLAADVPSIAAYCKAKGLRLLIDGAHGSIFPFHEDMPPTGIGIDGVDIVVQSMHKAAGAFSQSSVIHLNKTSSILQSQLETALFITASTSPSNLLLASIEEVVVRNFS